MTKTDNELRDELADAYATGNHHASFADTYENKAFAAGWSARDKVLLERGSSFDEIAAKEQAKHEDSDGYFGFLTGAEWQHEQLTKIYEAKLAKLEAEKAEMTKHIGKLNRCSIVYGKAKALKEGGGK